jgi:hypothetical protein
VTSRKAMFFADIEGRWKEKYSHGNKCEQLFVMSGTAGTYLPFHLRTDIQHLCYGCVIVVTADDTQNPENKYRHSSI